MPVHRKEKQHLVVGIVRAVFVLRQLVAYLFERRIRHKFGCFIPKFVFQSAPDAFTFAFRFRQIVPTIGEVGDIEKHGVVFALSGSRLCDCRLSNGTQKENW